VLRSFPILIFLLYASSITAASYEVIREESFDQSLFTQGFEKSENHFFISSGGYGNSFITKIDKQGQVQKKRRFGKHIFAEGLSEKDGILYVLSWKAGLAIKFKADTLDLLGSFSYKGEGWGLTHNNTHLLMSNGSNIIQFKNTDDFETERTLSVLDNGQALNRINELEFANESLWANVWHDNHIYQIDLDSGTVLKKWDLTELISKLKLRHPEAVLNGIAYDASENAFWITGKLWPKRYLIRFH